MKAVFLIDFEGFSPALKKQVRLFCQNLSSHVPVIWTITGDWSKKPTQEDGFSDRHRLFVKPDIDASFEAAKDKNGLALRDYLRTSGITRGYAAGRTYYGSVLVGAQSMKEIGIKPAIMHDLTDFGALSDDDHDEAREDFENANIPVTNSQAALRALNSSTRFGPTPP